MGQILHKTRKNSRFTIISHSFTIFATNSGKLRNMKHILFSILLSFVITVSSYAESRTQVLLKTNKGDITVELYNETPAHRDNFIRLCKEHFFDGLLFHRVIYEFMIQGGDPDSKGAEPDKHLGEGGPGYDLPAEIHFPQLFHKRGALAAAREGDDVNPERKSSGSQFYIVWGKKFTDEELEEMQETVQERAGITLPKEVCKAYRTIGGTPHLDGSYTVFGEVVDGLKIVDKIQQVKTNDDDRPKKDIIILESKVIENQPVG